MASIVSELNVGFSSRGELVNTTSCHAASPVNSDAQTNRPPAR
jgi:hypothetical protein